ncbi:MAG: hypothetical protein LRY32_06670 [Flavobacterium sp.]|nr:hypothetical protein [Flavobacterium sp.]
MGKNNNAPAKAGATSKEVKEKEVVAEVVETATEETAESVVETTTEETAEVVETTTEEKSTPVNGEFEVNGRKYKLSDRCPARLKFDGTIYSREELLTNKEIQKSLVIGESPFVKKV